MKRIIALLLALLLLASLSACRSKTEPEPDAAPAPAAAPEDPAEAPEEAPAEAPAETPEETEPFPAEMVGSWILVDSNDTELTEKTFPGVKELGGSMEIGADGLLFWTIGSSSGAGRIIEVQGDNVSAEFRSGNTGDPVPVPGLLENSNEALAFYLSYSGVDLIWVHVPPKSE